MALAALAFASCACCIISASCIRAGASFPVYSPTSVTLRKTSSKTFGKSRMARVRLSPWLILSLRLPSTFLMPLLEASASSISSMRSRVAPLESIVDAALAKARSSPGFTVGCVWNSLSRLILAGRLILRVL